MTPQKTALITGVTGQDGSYLAEFLLEKGYTVHGIKRRASSFNTQRVDHLYQDPHVNNARFKLHYGDLSDSSNLTRIIQETQPDEIYNLGAQSHVAVRVKVHHVQKTEIRNPILVSYVAKGLLPYHGLGSGIKRALSSWPDIEFSDDRDGCLFTATVHRNAPVNAPEPSLQVQLLNLVLSNPQLSYDKLAALTQKDRTTIMRNMAKLKAQGRLKRIGPAKGGHWQVIE